MLKICYHLQCLYLGLFFTKDFLSLLDLHIQIYNFLELLRIIEPLNMANICIFYSLYFIVKLT